MLNWRRLVSAYTTISLWGTSLAQNDTQHVSNELFDSLEELSRLVDISYCVGTSGVQKPFQCLSHCEEFPNLELVTVSFECCRETPMNIRDTDAVTTGLEYRGVIIRFMRLRGSLPRPRS